MSPLFPSRNAKLDTEKALWLDTAEREHDHTLRVLAAYPADRLDLKPTETNMSARELAFMFVREQGLLLKALTTGFDWSKPTSPQPPPDTLVEILGALREMHAQVIELVRTKSSEDLTFKTARFLTGPKHMDDVRLIDFMWMVLHDQIHHRGQMTIYSRLAGGTVPSIYGPSADENPFG